MLLIITNLEPKMENRNIILQDEIEDVKEVIFIMKGTVAVGYEINK